jgi:ATP-dependent Clp protease protease subunit
MTGKTVYIRFFAGINPKSVNVLMQQVEQKLKEGVERFVVVISSPGGQVSSGISAYNFLKGIPAEVATHNFGSIDSAAVVLYCAGGERFSVPHARFLIHGIGFNAAANERFNEKLLEERIASLRIDRQNISRVIADNTGNEMKVVEEDMLKGITLSAEEAKDYGLVHEIKSELFEKGAEIISITDT